MTKSFRRGFIGKKSELINFTDTVYESGPVMVVISVDGTRGGFFHASRQALSEPLSERADVLAVQGSCGRFGKGRVNHRLYNGLGPDKSRRYHQKPYIRGFLPVDCYGNFIFCFGIFVCNGVEVC